MSENIESLKEQALAELSSWNDNVEETTENTNNEENIETEENVEIEQEEEEIEDIVEEQEEEEIEEKPIDREELKKEVTKEVERELKKKYYSKLNKEQKKLAEAQAEIDSLKSQWLSDEQLDTIKKVVKAETQNIQVSKIEKTEKANFIKNNNPSADELKKIEEIKNDFPQMSWDYAQKLYYAEHKPEALIKKKSPNLSIIWGTPKSITEWADLNDPVELRKQAELEANRFAGR